jgi:hypothetical protein
MFEHLFSDICHVWLGIRKNKPREEFPNLKEERKWRNLRIETLQD